MWPGRHTKVKLAKFFVLKAPKTLYFVLPNDPAGISGGNIYNQYFIKALREQYTLIEKISFAAYQQAIYNNIPGIYWVDSLLLNQMQPLLRKQRANVTSCFMLHHLESLFPEKGKSSEEVFRQKEKTILDWFSAFLVTSDFSKQYLLKNQILQPVIVIPPAVSFPVSASNNSYEGIEALMVGNLIERKGIREFLESMSQQSSQFPHNFSLRILGRTDIDPDYAKACEKIIAENQFLKTRVHLIGPVPHEKMPECYKNSNLVISPSAMETFGMALQEAIAFGIPVLACKGGYAQYHIENGKTGQLFSSIADLTQHLIHLVNNPEKFDEMRGAAQQTARELIRYTWNDAAQLFISKLKSLGIN